MKKSIFSVILLFSFTLGVQASSVPDSVTLRAAVNFWNTYRPTSVKPISEDHLIRVVYGRPDFNMMHFYECIDGNGFIILSADDRVRPVLAYSFTTPLANEEINPELAFWLQGFNDQISLAVKFDMPPTVKTSSEWSSLLNDPVPNTPQNLTAVPAMLTTQWDQGSPYNQYCPYDNQYNARTVVGCVATAMAQIMKYWNYPSFGEGSHSYQPINHGGGASLPTITADFEHTTYMWQSMPNRLENFSLNNEIDAVATLSLHCGIAVEMMYGVASRGGSAAYSSCGYWSNYCASNALSQFFKYSPDLHLESRNGYTWSGGQLVDTTFFSDSAWAAMLDANLALGAPLYYAGSDSTSGHAFVLDGSDSAGRYHFNWGWSGYGDGFYTMDNLAPTANGIGSNATHTFNLSQDAIFGIVPALVETFDTVDYYDSICNNVQYIDFREYHLRVAEMDTLLRHLDTIFNYHLKIIHTKRVFLNPNISGKTPEVIDYCPATGFTFPECSFSKDSSLFIGWCRSKTGDDTVYQPGQTIPLNSNRTFFALWIDTSSSAGIQTLDDSDNIVLWPNPTSSEFSIYVPLHTISLNIIDALGRTVLREKTSNSMENIFKISLQGLPAGIYTIQIRTPNGIYNKRIIKQ